MHWRVVGAAALVAVVAMVAATTWAMTREGGAGAAGELERRLSRWSEPAAFRFDYVGGGTRVLDCFLPYRRFTGRVDYREGVVWFADASGAEVARKTQRRAFLHRRLFADGVVPTVWLGVDLPVAGEYRQVLTRALGSDLAGYVLAPSLPPSGPATARASLEAAAGVRHLGVATVAGREADGYQIVLDAERFEQMSVPEGAAPDRERDGEVVRPPVLEVWLDGRNEVARVVVRPGRVDGSPADGSLGWALDYTRERRDGPPPRMPRGAVTEAGSVDLASLTAAIGTGCEVPL